MVHDAVPSGAAGTRRQSERPTGLAPRSRRPGQVYVCSSLPVLRRLRRHLRLCVACGCAGPLVPLKCRLCSPPAAPGAAGRPVFHAIRTCQAICSGFVSKNLQNLKCKTATEETSRLVSVQKWRRQPSRDRGPPGNCWAGGAVVKGGQPSPANHLKVQDVTAKCQ